MRLVVPVKQVPETQSVRMDEATGTMIRDGVESVLNPLDLYAVETALRLRDTCEAVDELVAVSMGPAASERALREAVAMGIDRAVLLSDRAFAGADTWATSYTLAAAVRKLGGADLILCGERATDGDTGQVGPGLAAFLDLPVVTYVSKLTLNSDGLCTVERLVERGREHLTVPCPVVVTVVKEIADPRLPTLRGKQRARHMDIPVWDAAALDCEPHSLGLKGSPTRVERIFRPSLSRHCDKLEVRTPEELQQACSRTVELIHEVDPTVLENAPANDI